MSDSVTTSVEVAVAPDVAFDVFTREIDAWYRVDPDTLPDITRTAAIRLEPHVGGRLLDVHDIATGAGREMGRVTAWEPARRLAFSDNEGTEVEVSFEPCGAGTRVTLTHRGLDRLTIGRAAQLRRCGWAALTPFYTATTLRPPRDRWPWPLDLSRSPMRLSGAVCGWRSRSREANPRSGSGQGSCPPRHSSFTGVPKTGSWDAGCHRGGSMGRSATGWWDSSLLGSWSPASTAPSSRART